MIWCCKKGDYYVLKISLRWKSIYKNLKKRTNRPELQNKFIANVKNNRKSLKQFNKSVSGKLNFAISGVSGVGLGVLGIGIPNICNIYITFA